MKICLKLLRGTIGSLIGLALLLQGCSSNPHAPRDERKQAYVERIIDGDTLVLELKGQKESYRLLAIDAPELSASDHADRQARRFNVEASQIRQLGKLAKLRLERLLPRGSLVEIEFDTKPRDRYRRPLVYLYLPGDALSLNERLLEEGSVWFFNPNPNNRHTQRMRGASERSSRERRGVWAFSRKRN